MNIEGFMVYVFVDDHVFELINVLKKERVKN